MLFYHLFTNSKFRKCLWLLSLLAELAHISLRNGPFASLVTFFAIKFILSDINIGVPVFPEEISICIDRLSEADCPP